MKMPQGPKLEMPDLKVPRFATDVYYDLRDRRLLPLVALVVVAIAAVPFLLGQDADEVQPPAAGGAGQSSIPTTGARLTVVPDTPGLRDYRKRLQARTRTDPFKQRYTGLPEEAQLKSVDVTSDGGGAASSTVESTPGAGSDGAAGGATPPLPSPAGSTGGGSGDDDLEDGRLYGFRPDLRFGVAGSGQLKLYRELPLGSLLPQKRPVLLFIGVTQNGNRALFNVVPEVTQVNGDGDCIGGSSNCQILSMQAGQAVTLVTEQPGRSFRLKLERIEFVELPMPRDTEQASNPRDELSDAGWADGFTAVDRFRR
jgi:hypothetical protein